MLKTHKKTRSGIGQCWFFLDLVISLCLQQHNQNFTLVLDHYSQTPPFKCRWNAICCPSWIVMGLFFLKTMFQMANSVAWWQHSVFKKYFLTNNGQRKTKGKGASVVVAEQKKKKKRKLFFILPTECRAATLGHLSRCNRTAQNMTWQQCFHPPASKLALALLTNPYTWHGNCNTKREIWLQCSHRRVKWKQPAWVRSVKSDFQISGTAWAAFNSTKHQ